MKQFPYKQFANLCEGYITEVSSSLTIVGQHPGGKQVIQNLHQKMQLGHDIQYKPVDKISWSDLKNAYRGAWVIIVGANGTGAIKANNGNYEALASTGGEVEQKRDGRGGNILDFLKSNIGKLQKYYVGTNTNTVRDKQSKRSDNKQVAGPGVVNQDTLIKKFRPLWVKAMNAALADVKGMAGTMIKNDAYEKAEKKINICRQLQNAIDEIEGGATEVPSSITRAVQSAIYMAAAHYYPEQTGEITRSRYGSSGVSAERSEGPAQLLKDISGGDTAKLGTILGFFKRSLITS